MVQIKNKSCMAFLVNSSKTLGLGHLKRCLILAESLSKNNIHCIFLISNNNKEDIEKHGYEVFKVNHNHLEVTKIKKILETENCQALIIDSKRKSILKIIKNVKKSVRIILIDNQQFKKFADLTILPSIHKQFDIHTKNCLMGPKYILINPKFKQQKIKNKNFFILLSTGGSDKKNITIRVVSAFKEIKSDFKLLVVLGKFYTNEKKLYNLISNDNRFVIMKDPKNFPDLMHKCSLGIITFGVTVYEAAFAKLPVFVISHSNENDISAKRIMNCSWFRYLGKYDQIKYMESVNEIISYYHNDQLLTKMLSFDNGIDGKGAKRITNEIIKLCYGN